MSLSLEKHLHVQRQRLHQRPSTAPSSLLCRKADLKQQAASPRPQTAESCRRGRAEFHGDATEKTRRRHEEIVRKILEEFDLEATKKKYRSFDAVDMRITGSSAAEYGFRQELMKLMGSETIRLNDRDWNRKYHESLRQDYERALVEKEHQLAEKERERIHRLRLEGIVVDNASSADHEKKKSKRRKSKRKSTYTSLAAKRMYSSDSTKERAHTESVINQLNAQIHRPSVKVVDEVERMCKPLKTDKEEQTKEQPKQRPTNLQVQISKAPSDSSATDPSIKTLLQADLKSLLSSTRSELSPGVSRQGVHVSQETMFLSREEHKLHTRELLKQKRAKQGLSRIVLPEIAELYQEETIAGLYAIAKQIVGVFKLPPQST